MVWDNLPAQGNKQTLSAKKSHSREADCADVADCDKAHVVLTNTVRVAVRQESLHHFHEQLGSRVLQTERVMVFWYLTNCSSLCVDVYDVWAFVFYIFKVL